MTLRRFEARGLRCLIAEDVITTGKSSLECAAALEQSGALVAAAACLVDRRPAADCGFPGPPWPVYAACRVEAESREPSLCELCGQGIPLVKPGSRKQV
jgi:orotate phosphoribosyltransferase